MPTLILLWFFFFFLAIFATGLMCLTMDRIPAGIFQRNQVPPSSRSGVFICHLLGFEIVSFHFLIHKPAVGFDYPGSPLPGRQDPSREWLFHMPLKQHHGLKAEAGGLRTSCCTEPLTVKLGADRLPPRAQGDIPYWYLRERIRQVPFWKPPELNRPKTEQKERKKKKIHCTVSPNLRKWSLGTEKSLTQLSSGLRTASTPPTGACCPERIEQQKPRPSFSNLACYKPE